MANSDGSTLFWGDGLFSTHYLTQRLHTTAAWAGEAEAAALFATIRRVFDSGIDGISRGNEEDVEDRFVGPILAALGFAVQKRRRISGSTTNLFPDFLLYGNATDVENAYRNGEHYSNCIGILEAKRWAIPLQKPATNQGRSPHLQLRDYLNQRPSIGWGIVTNGAEWRLYARAAAASEFLAIDLAAIFARPDSDEAVFAFRLFLSLFGKAAFVDGGRQLDNAREGAERFREEIEAQLRRQVFDGVEILARGFLLHAENRLADPDLPAVFENTLILLYRLLFVLNAEARGLLPTEPSSPYVASFGLERVREKLSRPDTAAEYADDGSFQLWGRLDGLFRLINGEDGDRNERLGIPRYNGGLFDPAKYPFLHGSRVADSYLSEAIQTLTFRREPDGAVTAFDYAGLGERHLGSIYEGLLEHTLRRIDGAVVLQNDRGERKAQGAYYTPQAWVAYLVKASLTPLLVHVSRSEDGVEAGDDSFATAVLALNVCDPAMGSGHFLVEVTSFLAEAVAAHPTTVTGDLAYWKRRVVEACIYGVDRNPLAVELAKLSLWLKTVDRVPLNFLDHHLRCGNSLIGTTLDALPRFPDARKRAATRKGTIVQLSLMFSGDLQAAIADAIGRIHTIEGTSTDTHEVAKRKEALWRELSETVMPRFTAVADLWTAPYFGADDISWVRFQSLLDDEAATEATRSTYSSLLDLVRPFHWELAFPDVFFDEKGNKKFDPGFDAVIGNPPWERIKLAENEFFAARDPAIAAATRASDRKRLVTQLLQSDPELASALADAKRDAERVLNFVQNSGFYPLMGRGDTNLYAVFAEKATQIAAKRGRVGLLVPSGIATDSTTSPFFREVVQNERLAELLDFENGNTFPDVDSRFKFSVLLLAGEGDPQKSARCGFFLSQIDDLDDPARTFPLTPEDFATFNPNTSTCPIFRRREDVALTRKLYAAAPVLIRNGRNPGDPVVNPWGVRFSTMFHMTNDSDKFKRRAELDADGYWLGAGNVFTRGTTRFLPLYEGKMVQMYDHRAASVKINPRNVHRAAQEDPTTVARHDDPDFSATPQYWVEEEEVLLSVSNVPPILLAAYRTRGMNAIRQAFTLWIAGWKANGGEESVAIEMISRNFPTQSAMSQMLQYRNAVWIAQEYEWSAANQRLMTQLFVDGAVAGTEAENWLAMAAAVIRANKPAFLIGYKDVTAPTNVRSVIPAAIPLSGVGNTFCLMLAKPQFPAHCLLANLSSIVLDYAARQKIGGQHLNFFIVEQFPVLPPETYAESRHGIELSEFVKTRVLELCYTSHDMRPMAESLGYFGQPFPWDEERRLHLRCQLDGLYFVLYGMDEADTLAILDTFPIIRRQDEARYDGRFRTRDLVVGYRRAYAAGNWDAKVRG